MAETHPLCPTGDLPSLWALNLLELLECQSEKRMQICRYRFTKVFCMFDLGPFTYQVHNILPNWSLMEYYHLEYYMAETHSLSNCEYCIWWRWQRTWNWNVRVRKGCTYADALHFPLFRPTMGPLTYEAHNIIGRLTIH